MVRIAQLATLAGLFVTIFAQSTTLRYMPLGDSITAITCWRAFLWDKLQKGGYTKVDFVGSQSAAALSTCSGLNYDKNNEGHIGYLASDIANQKLLPGWLKTNPVDIVTVYLGTNDIWHKNQSTTDTIAAYSTLVDQMRASNPKTKIIVAQITPLLAANAGGGNAAVQALNAAIPSWATRESTNDSPIFSVDLFSNITNSELLDGIHPNDAGSQILATRLYPVMVQAIQSIQNASAPASVFKS